MYPDVVICMPLPVDNWFPVLYSAIARGTISIITRGPWKFTMATTRRAMVLCALVLQLLMVGATASPLADSTNPLGDATKMNADLVERLDEVEDTTILPVIFQLHSPTHAR